jgi:AAA+ superfamily predicted ATPase
MAAETYQTGAAHLLDELEYLNLMLRRAVLLQRARRAGAEPDPLRGMLITEAEIDRLMAAGERGGPDVADLDDAIDAQRGQIRERIERSRAAGVRLPLAQLAAMHALSEAETDLLLVALGPEIETFYETSYAYLQNDVTRKRPSVELALELICRSPHEKLIARRLLAEDSRLVAGGLVHLGEESYDRQPTLLRRFLKMDDSALRFVLEQPPAAREGVRVVDPGAHEPELSVSAESAGALDALAQALGRSGIAGSLVHLEGGAEAPLTQAAEALGSALGRRVMITDFERLAQSPEAAAALVHDAVLWDALPVLRLPPAGAGEGVAARPPGYGETVWRALRDAGLGVVALGHGDDLRRLPPDFRLWRIQVDPPSFEERQALWRAVAGPSLPAAEVERLADLYPFGAERIRQTAALARTHAALAGQPDTPPDLPALMRAARTVATPNLQRFATVYPPRLGWSDIILPDDRKQQLRSLTERVTNRAMVQRDWGFADKQTRGRGLAVLFSGPPGTGKTMAAEIIASELSLELFQIDLSTVMSKYIGDMEKHISTIFAEAEQGQCVLFFDECDAVFGKRMEVRDAHDYYANTQVNYLLQRLEQYEGIVLLATNFQQNIDEAFMRRLQDSVDFPFPDEDARKQIWRLQFPARAPVGDLDFGALATHRMAGGAIRNAAQYAAYRAAEGGGPQPRIEMEHVLEGIRREFQKMGKLVVAADQARDSGRSLRA